MAIGVSFIKTYIFSTSLSTPNLIDKTDPLFKNAYFVFFQTYFSLINFGLPLLISIICYTSLVFMEDRHNMWVFHANRKYYRKMHLAKLGSIAIFLFCFILSAFLSAIIAVKLLISHLPSIYVYHKPTHLIVAGIWFFKFFIASLGVACLHYIIILFFPLKKLRLSVALFLPYALLFLPNKINPYAFLFNHNKVAYQIRKLTSYETEYNIHKIKLIDSQDWISLAYIGISLLLIWLMANTYKRFLTA